MQNISLYQTEWFSTFFLISSNIFSYSSTIFTKAVYFYN